MKFPNLGPPSCMPRPKMVRNSWTLRGRLQCILARRPLPKNDDNELRKEEPKSDGYILGPYLRQRVENL